MPSVSEHIRTWAPVIVGDRHALERACRLLGAELRCALWSILNNSMTPPLRHRGRYQSFQRLGTTVFGQPTPATCQAVIHSTRKRPVWPCGRVAAVAPAPSTAVLQRHGFTFPGHTNFSRHSPG